MVSWKERLVLPDGEARDIDIFETQIELRKAGRIEEKLFAETRLRRGVYGQRYDNGSRHDGEKTQEVKFPSGTLTKGPSTVWDAPGMQRIKIPYGKLSAEALEVLADCAEEYSDGVLHITTRQDVQLHFVHIEDTPDLMRRMAAVGVTTKEACGNTVRNITACPNAGVCNDESFDVSPYAHAATYFLLGHDETQDFGRKVKVAFSGCSDHPCGLTNFHDIGLVARTKAVDGLTVRGFEFYVGGGLGSVPQPAQLLYPFVTEDELFPMFVVISRLFTRLGERDNRARARLKFVLKKVGLEAFRAMADEERKKLRDDPRWTAYAKDLGAWTETAKAPPSEHADVADPGLARWLAKNVRRQAQAGYSTATVLLPLGDMTSSQARGLASIARDITGDTMRTTVEQNLMFRWVSNRDLPELHRRLVSLGLAEAGASAIADITACPGTDTCKLGISSSRGLASELRRRLTVLADEMPAAKSALHIKTSGCFNSCGQHHVADLGFLGVSRNVGGRRVPHFQLVVGGEWTHNGGKFGLAIGAIPSKNVPLMVERMTARYLAEKGPDETFTAYVERLGKKEIRLMVEALSATPAYEENRDFYSDWGDPREYSIGDLGVGECAGEVVPIALMNLAAAEREVFESQLLLEEGKPGDAAGRALRAMLTAARALCRERRPGVSDDPNEIVEVFQEALVAPKLFWDPFSGGKFGHYLTRAHREGTLGLSTETAHQRVEEAQLFVEAAYQCYDQLALAKGAA